MKKIFRMALVFALAGATLMYTGCTKDYDEDITAVNQKVNDLDKDLAEAQGKLADALSKIDGLQQKDADLQKAIDGLKDDLKNYATKEDLNQIAEDLQGLIEDLEESLGGDIDALSGDIDTLNDALNDVNEALDILNKELRSLVFVPQLYFAGVEAAEYKYANVDPIEMIDGDDEVYSTGLGFMPMPWMRNDATTFYFDEDAEVAFEYADDPYTLGQIATAEYNINPSSFDVKKAAWSLEGKDYRYLVRGEEAPLTWIPEVYGDVTAKNGVAVVRYQIANPEKISNTVYEQVMADANNALFGYAAELNQVLKANDIELAKPDPDPKPEKSNSWLWNDKNEIDKAESKALVELLVALFGEDFFEVEGEATPDAKARKKEWAIENAREVLAKNLGTYNTDPTVNFKFMLLQSEITGIVTAMTQAAFWLYDIATANYEGTGIMSSMKLNADLGTADAAKNISSDYAALVADCQGFSALAFSKASNYTTFRSFWTPSCAAGSHLYTAAFDAVVNQPSVPVAYNKELDLDFIRIHMFEGLQGGKDAEYTLAELKEVYPELSFDFSLVDYYYGDVETSESNYAKISGNKLIPMLVDENGDQQERATSANGGISSVGRMPIVLVKLFDDDNLVLAGYFKVEIVKEVGNTVVNFPTFGTIPYICSPTPLKTNYAQFNKIILEDLNTTYESFSSNYKLYANGVGMFGAADYTSLKQGREFNAVVFVYNEEEKTFDATTDFGKIVYTVDNAGNSQNDKFTWTIDKDAADEIGEGESKTVYVQFKSVDGYEYVWVSFTVTVAERAQYVFAGTKLANEWYTDVDPEAKTTVRANVKVPNNNTIDNVTSFYRYLDEWFVGAEPEWELAEDTAELYLDEELEDELETSYEYSFSENQPKIGDVQLGVFDDAPYKRLYAVTADNKKGELIAVINADDDGDEYIQLATTNTAKKLLNLFSIDETEAAKMLYANVRMDVYYGDCDIQAGDSQFYVRFLRPLDINWTDGDLDESSVKGDDVKLISCLEGITDWNKQLVVKANNHGILEENRIEGVNMYKYYQFDYLKVDLAKATRDQFSDDDLNAKKSVKEVTPWAKLEVVGPSAYYTAVDGVYTIDIKDLYTLRNFSIHYENERASIESFNLYVPVTVGYAWGEISDTLVIKVSKTSEFGE